MRSRGESGNGRPNQENRPRDADDSGRGCQGHPAQLDQDKVKVTIKGPIVETDVMTTREAAAYLKLSRQFLEGARHRGDGSGPDYLKWGRSVRYHRAQLDAWIAKSVHPADEPVG